MENRVDLAHAELLSIQQLARVSVREVLRVKWYSSLGREPFEAFIRPVPCRVRQPSKLARHCSCGHSRLEKSMGQNY